MLALVETICCGTFILRNFALLEFSCNSDKRALRRVILVGQVVTELAEVVSQTNLEVLVQVLGKLYQYTVHPVISLLLVKQSVFTGEHPAFIKLVA